MTALYADPNNVEGVTYGKRWRRHEWSQIVEAQASEEQRIVAAVKSMAPAVVSVNQGSGGGSGVIIRQDGLNTN